MSYNPRSLENLIHEGRPREYDEPKKPRQVTVTGTGWEGVRARVKELGFSSVSQFLEEFGRGANVI